MRVLWSSSTSVHHNLALEEWWLDHFVEQGPVLLFYVNAPALVLGKNQNPWREAATGWARREGVAIARRVSGGGTVYHDEGDLNFTLILPRAAYEQNSVFEKTLSALCDLGLPATLFGGNSIVASGKKVSGTAFCFRGAAALHHGTLLVHSNLHRLRCAMVPALPDVITRAIASKPASVANANEFVPNLTLERAATALAQHLAGSAAWSVYAAPQDRAFNELRARHEEWDWVFGHTPAFEWTIKTPESSLTLHVQKGLVDQTVATGKPLVSPSLSGCRFSMAELDNALVATPWRAAFATHDF